VAKHKTAPEPDEPDPIDVALRAWARAQVREKTPDAGAGELVEAENAAAGDAELRGLMAAAVSAMRDCGSFTRCPARMASDLGTVVRCMFYSGHPAYIDHFAHAVGKWNDDDDRAIHQ
jgi:hypothetical protein